MDKGVWLVSAVLSLILLTGGCQSLIAFSPVL